MSDFEIALRADLQVLRARKEAAANTASKVREQLRREREAANRATLQRNQQIRATAQM